MRHMVLVRPQGRIPMGIGQVDSTLAKLAAPIVSQVLKEQLPNIQATALTTFEAAQPMIREIVREEVMPKVITGIVIGMGVGAIIGALTGSYIASRRRR